MGELVFGDNSEVDGTTNRIDANFAVDDSGTVTVAGTYTPAGGATDVLTGGPFTLTVPGSGTNYYVIEANTTTGACTLLTSTSAFPAVDAQNIEIYRDSLASTAGANISQDQAAGKTPDF